MSRQSRASKKAQKAKADLVPSMMSIYGKPCVVVFSEDENALLSLNESLSNLDTRDLNNQSLALSNTSSKKKMKSGNNQSSSKKIRSKQKKNTSYDVGCFSKKEIKKIRKLLKQQNENSKKYETSNSSLGANLSKSDIKKISKRVAKYLTAEALENMIYANAMNMAHANYTHLDPSIRLASPLESYDQSTYDNLKMQADTDYITQSAPTSMPEKNQLYVEQAAGNPLYDMQASSSSTRYSGASTAHEQNASVDSHVSNSSSSVHASKIVSSTQSTRPVNDGAKAFPRASNKERMVLEYLATHPDATQTELSSVLLVSRSTIADYTSSLQGKGYLKREGTRRDGRWIVKGIA